MWIRLLAFLGLFFICSSGCALKLNEDIQFEGYGKISAETNGKSVYDKIDAFGDNQTYTRELTCFEYGQAKLISNYIYI
jgi:hypothetical protein